jgi:hypothetical protein
MRDCIRAKQEGRLQPCLQLVVVGVLGGEGLAQGLGFVWEDGKWPANRSFLRICEENRREAEVGAPDPPSQRGGTPRGPRIASARLGMNLRVACQP